MNREPEQVAVDWLEFIERKRLLINCNADGVLVVDSEGRQVRGHDLKQVLESMR